MIKQRKTERCAYVMPYTVSVTQLSNKPHYWYSPYCTTTAAYNNCPVNSTYDKVPLSNSEHAMNNHTG